MRRRFRPFFAWLAAFALVFAQLATAAYACPQLAQPTARMQAPDCDHDRDVTPNLCERHCDYGKASIYTPKPVASPDLAVLSVRPVIIALPIEQPRVEYRAHTTTGPPVTRFTVLRI